MPSLVEIQRQWPDKIKVLDRLDERLTKLEECLGSDRLDMLHGEVAELIETVNRLNAELKKAKDEMVCVPGKIDTPDNVFITPYTNGTGNPESADNITSGGSEGKE